jgi:hypothetical protein
LGKNVISPTDGISEVRAGKGLGFLYFAGQDGNVKGVEGTWYSSMPTTCAMSVQEWREMKTWLLFALPAMTGFTLTEKATGENEP